MLHSLLISSGGEKSRRQHALKLARELDPQLQPDSPDLRLITNEKKAIGIDQIRQLQAWLQRKPYQASHKAAIIFQAEGLTTEAQNALLKTLEEPPRHSSLILTTVNRYRLLPTIRSRCQIINLTKKPTTAKSGGKNLTHFLNLPLAQKINCAQRMGKKKQKLSDWLDKQIQFYRQQNKRGGKEAGRLVAQLEETRQMINHNVSPKLALEYLLLNERKSEARDQKSA